MVAEAFVITELTGPKREIQLFDRALPYQKLEMGREQRHVKREYAGSRVATIQVMGVSILNWEAEGMWKTRFLGAGHNVELKNFPDIPNDGGRITAEDLVDAMQRILDAGQNVEVRWGPAVRRGILAGFTPTWDRVEDVAWRLSFVWAQDGEAPPRRASVSLDTTSGMRRALDQLDLVAAEMPSTILPTQADDLIAKIGDVRVAGAALTESLAALQATTTSTIADVQNAQTLADRVVQAAEALRTGNLSDLPYVSLLPVDDVSAVLEAEVWRRDTAASSRTVQAEARRSSAATADRSMPGAVAVVTLTENTSLRVLAVRYYGDADAWTTIADANGLISSIAAAGLRLVIPRPAGQGVVTR
jgi:hypothetical protein